MAGWGWAICQWSEPSCWTLTISWARYGKFVGGQSSATVTFVSVLGDDQPTNVVPFFTTSALPLIATCEKSGHRSELTLACGESFSTMNSACVPTVSDGSSLYDAHSPFGASASTHDQP